MAGLKNNWRTSVLMMLLILLGLGGIGGGITLLMDPSGELMGLPGGLLDQVFIDDYFLPGMFLIIVMGLMPYGVFFCFWKDLPWAWIAALIQGIILVSWILFQIVLWRNPIALQWIYLFWGAVLVYLSLRPEARSQQS